MLIEKSKFKDSEDFQTRILKEKKSHFETDKTFEKFIKNYITDPSMTKKEHVEYKNLTPDGMIQINFNLSIKILSSRVFKELYDVVKETVFCFLLQQTIFLYKEESFYYQINGYSLS